MANRPKGRDIPLRGIPEGGKAASRGKATGLPAGVSRSMAAGSHWLIPTLSVR